MALTDYDSLGNERRRPLPGREGQGKWDGGKGRARRRARRGDYNYNYKETRHLNASTAPRRTSTAATLFSRERSRRAGRWASMPAHPGSMAPPKAHAAPPYTIPRGSHRMLIARGGGLARPPSRHLLASVHTRRPSHTNTILFCFVCFVLFCFCFVFAFCFL